jgi:hypothetical protein
LHERFFSRNQGGGKMKVKEVVELLKELDQEKEIKRLDEGFPEPIENIEETTDYYYID